jgi:hypothetical protein
VGSLRCSLRCNLLFSLQVFRPSSQLRDRRFSPLLSRLRSQVLCPACNPLLNHPVSPRRRLRYLRISRPDSQPHSLPDSRHASPVASQADNLPGSLQGSRPGSLPPSPLLCRQPLFPHRLHR